MKTYFVAVRKKLREKTGMTLAEVLAALAVLFIAILCFLPLAQSSYRNIHSVGEKTKSNYKAVGLIERLIGNNGANGAYETQTDNVPLQMKVKGNTLQANSGAMKVINGVTIASKPENVSAGYTTFVSDSVTAKMVCYPSHISDDFLTKTITLYAAGFRFSDIVDFRIYYTDNAGKPQPVAGGLYNDSNPYCRIKIDTNNASIAYLTLVGDNDVIRFENSPLIVTYRKPILESSEGYEIDIEIDAPTVIMVGEEASDGNYYYYVTSGEPDEDGNLDIIRKKMNSVDPLAGRTGSVPNKITGNVTLTSAMNDVEWVAAGEGDDGNGGTNPYGYYVMCGDNGQIRRFWKNPATGNYGWGGDYTIAHEYYYNGDESATPTVTKEKMYSTTVDSSYVYIKDPTKNVDDRTDDAYGINLIPDTNDVEYDDDWAIWDSLYTQTAFSVNALNKHPDIEVYTAGNLLYAYWNKDIYSSNATDTSLYPFYNNYVNTTNDGWLDAFRNNTTNGNAAVSIDTAKPTTIGRSVLNLYSLNHKNATVKRRANDMKSYKAYYGLDADTTNYITLTSVDAVTMKNSYSSSTHPTRSYTLYCGYIPAVMDLWATNLGVAPYANYNFGEWRATLGLAFEDNTKELIQANATKYFYKLGGIYRAKNKWKKYVAVDGYLWRYSDAKASNYALSGICGPKNYDPAKTRALTDSIAMAWNAYGKSIYPLHTTEYQAQIQNQNTTAITVAYLSNPYALSGAQVQHNGYPLSPDRYDMDGVFEWAFDDSTTIMDSDSLYYEDYDGHNGFYSIAVGYYVGGLVFDSHDSATKGMIASPSVMNNGIVYLRSGGANDAGLGDGYTLQQESNVFNEFYCTNDYWKKRNTEVATKNPNGSYTIWNKNTMHRAVSAGYWRDCYHPLFYSTFGATYDPNDSKNKYSYMMGHILQDKKLNSVSWGMTWNESPEAMWGASDGTLMSWYLDLDALQKGNAAANNDESITCEFQSYKKLEYANQHKTKYGTTSFESRWVTSGVSDSSTFSLPTTTAEMTAWIKSGKEPNGDKNSWNNAADTNMYWDKCSIQLKDTDTYGFISPLDTIEDVAYANDTWVACGVQGAANPRYYNGIELCKPAAVVKKLGSSDEGSWICVRSWYDQSGGTDSGPCSGNSNFVWQAVQISTIKNCNIQQVTYCNGMWYAVGYIDTNDNGQYDYTVESGKQREHAVVFYAVDPAQPCGTEQGWRLSDNGHKGYTQAYANDGSGNYSLMNIDGVNSVASRND